MFVRFATCVYGLQNRIEVTGSYGVSGAFLSWHLRQGAQNVYSYDESAPQPNAFGSAHYLSPSEYVSVENPCYLDAPAIGPVPITLGLPVGLVVVQGELTVYVTGEG